MKLLPANHQYFDVVQDINVKVTHWDTHLTVPSKGMVYRPATPISTFGTGINLMASGVSSSDLHTHFDNHTVPGLVDNNGIEVYGRIPLVHMYWGTGAPIGVSASNRAALRIRGYVKKAGNYALVFTGRGNVRVFHNNTSILARPITEDQPGVTNQTATNKANPFRSYNVGDLVEIFFWAINEPWGGLSVRVTDDTGAFDANNEIVWDVLRDADVLAASWMDDNGTVKETVLEDVVSASVEVKRGQTIAARITLALSDSNDFAGWYYDAVTNSVVQNVIEVVSGSPGGVPVPSGARSTVSLMGTPQRVRVIQWGESQPTDPYVDYSANGTRIKIGHRIRLSGGFGDDGQLIPEFTGFVDDIIANGETVTLECRGFEHRMARQISENYPDRISYASFGYTGREGVTEPVWAVPAYDHWPYEYAVKDMCYRAWIDPSLLRAKKLILLKGETDLENAVEGAPLFRCRSLSGTLIRIPRQPHYGNPTGRPNAPPDDEYLIKSEISESLYQRVMDLANRIGYTFHTDAWGNFVFRPVNSPVAEVPLINITGGTQAVNPNAIGGTYRVFSGTAWNYTYSGIRAGRIDLVVGRGPGLGTINVTVTRQEDGAQFTNTYSLHHTEDIFFYDQIYTTEGRNACALTILQGEEYGTYTVTVTPSGGSSSTEYRLDAFRIYEQDPAYPHPQFQLRTFKNALEVTPRSAAADRLNDAVVTGKRQSTLTDSAKVTEQVEQEFIVSRAQDVHSILNPNASNYLGTKVTAFLSDEAIADQDLADWTANRLVTQYRLPKPDATIRHTALPVLELLDPIFVRDDRFGVFDGTAVMWVTGIQTEYRLGDQPSAISTIEATAFEVTPSFEPREEIDISLYGNKPVINLSITYPTLTGGVAVNPPDGLVRPVESGVGHVVASGIVVQDGNGLFVTVPNDVESPGSDLLLAFATGMGWKAFKNYPYYKFYSRSGNRLNIMFSGGDGSNYYGPASWGISAGTPVEYHYIKLENVYSGNSPFYDPYTSELDPPRLIAISFDNLVSGYYRVSIVDARSKTTETTVAWLTEPTNTDPDGDQHWSYMTPGTNRTFFWDGVDNIGTWNRKQTARSLWAMRGSFPEKASDRFEIGAGYYAQNDQSAPISHISAEVVDGEPAYPVGKYAQFYVKIECIRDTQNSPLVVRSNTEADLYDSAANPLTPRYIYYHLHPKPNRVTVDIEDWNFAANGPYTPGASGTWSSTPDANATIRDEKPVRIKITPVPRKGAAYSGTSREVSVKLHRVVHLTAISLDESLVFLGQPWNVKSTNERKRVVSRRTVNDNHTIVFEDPSFRRGDTLEDWIFYPSLFRDDFGNGEEPLEYLNYLQLFEVPHWNPGRVVGDTRSRFIVGLMAYLFYLSVFTQDRSGRLVWAIDPTHVDKSKILTNTEPMTWPFDLERHQRRVIYTRQWWDSDLLAERYGPAEWNVPQQYWGAFSDRFDPFDTVSSGTLYPLNNGAVVSGSTLTGYQDPFSTAIKNGGWLPIAYNVSRDLGDTQSTVLGHWTWESDGILWIPDITRDFHPYYLIPPMGLSSRRRQHSGGKWWPYWAADHTHAMVVHQQNTPPDEAQYDTWFTVVESYWGMTGDYPFLPGKTVDEQFRKKDEPTMVPWNVADFQKIDEIIRYEDCRGGVSNGPANARDVIMVTGGDPYYLNPVRYRYFRSGRTRYHTFYCDVDQKGWFSLTFRHTYVWESPSMFPLSTLRPELRLHDSAGMDTDLTGWPGRAAAYDPGAWAGWKDDHPSTLQNAGSFWDTGTCATLHWRDDEASVAGGTCELENPQVTTLDVDGNTSETLAFSYAPNRNVLRFEVPPIAVGPRLPETRRVLLALNLVNERRTRPVNL